MSLTSKFFSTGESHQCLYICLQNIPTAKWSFLSVVLKLASFPDPLVCSSYSWIAFFFSIYFWLYRLCTIFSCTSEISVIRGIIPITFHSYESVLPVIFHVWWNKSDFFTTPPESPFISEIALIVFLEIRSRTTYLSSIFMPDKCFYRMPVSPCKLKEKGIPLINSIFRTEMQGNFALLQWFYGWF